MIIFFISFNSFRAVLKYTVLGCVYTPVRIVILRREQHRSIDFSSICRPEEGLKKVLAVAVLMLV